MNRGTRVAQAYTELHVDGSDMNKEIVDSVEDAQPGVEKAGDKAGKEYGDAFDQAFADRISKKISKSLDKSLAKSVQKTGKNLGKSLGEALAEGLGDNLESVGRMLDDLESRVADVSRNGGSGGSGSGTGTGDQGPTGPLRPPPSEQRYIQAAYKANEDLQRAMQKMNAAIAQKTAETRLKIHQENTAAIAKDDAELVKRQQKILDLAAKNYEAMVKENATIAQTFAEKRIKMHVASNLAIEKDDERLLKAQEALYKRLEKENAKRQADETRASTRSSTLGATVGAMFGAGSRNNFLNLVGKSLGNIVDLSAKVGSVVGKTLTTFSKGFTSAAEGATFLQKSLSGLSSVGSQAGAMGSKAFAGLATTGPAAIAVVGILIVVMSALVSVMSALLAIVTALVATIASALVGALLVAGGAMAALVAAGGLLTAAFMSMTDAQKNLLKDAFQPLKAEMVGIAQVMLEQMVPAFSTWSTNLQHALLLALPVARVMGAAFAEAGNTLTAAFSGPGFQAFANALGVYLPSIVTRLSLALGSFLNGLTGMFAAIMPMVNRFAGYLAQVAERFSVWANSAQGQNSIVDFTNRAVESLQSLWNFVREFTGFLADVLFSPEAQNFGNGMFDSLARSFEGFRQKIADGSLEKWFKDAAAFGAQLWEVIKSIGDVFEALNNSGVLEMVGSALESIAVAVEWAAWAVGLLVNSFGSLSPVLGPLISPLKVIDDALGNLGAKAQWANDLLTRGPLGILLGIGGGGGGNSSGRSLGDIMGGTADKLLSQSNASGSDRAMANRAGTAQRVSNAPTLNSLIKSGNSALNQTSVDAGGYKPKPVKPEVEKYINPYTEWANKLIEKSPNIKTQIRKALWAMNRSVAEAFAEATTGDSLEAARSAMSATVDEFKTKGDSLVDAAQNALNSAAQTLAGAGNKKDAKAALKKVKAAQKDMKEAIKAQGRLNKAAAIVSAQELVRPEVVSNLLNGFVQTGATLSEYAAAREAIAVQIENANQKLADAIALRDNYSNAVADSIKSFAAIATAQAKTINGVAQALTATDVTDNLRARLEKIRAFQSNLRVLLAQGLSNAAYKQIVDAGAEEGGAIADAIVKGGQGAVSDLNGLVGSIDSIADSIGGEAGTRLYQAGVDAAQGLVDGLNSLSGQLDAAAARLGYSIAQAVKNALGIASPSKVLYDMMDPVGDGIEDGLDNQHNKVGSAAVRLSKAIAVSPEVAAHASRQGESPYVSRNGVASGDPKFLWTGDIVTPTEDPHAVATEVMNELVERL